MLAGVAAGVLKSRASRAKSAGDACLAAARPEAEALLQHDEEAPAPMLLSPAAPAADCHSDVGGGELVAHEDGATFTRNGRHFVGNALHQAALVNDHETMHRILEPLPSKRRAGTGAMLAGVAAGVLKSRASRAKSAGDACLAAARPEAEALLQHDEEAPAPMLLSPGAARGKRSVGTGAMFAGVAAGVLKSRGSRAGSAGDACLAAAQLEAEALLHHDEESQAPAESSPGAPAAECHSDIDVAQLVAQGDGATFTWNGRHCTGNALHKAAMVNDHWTMHRILEAAPAMVNSRFSYETSFRGVRQEGSGEAIHIAASGGSKKCVELLLASGASIHAAVTRDHKAHYDVLHAAVFAEGRGGSLRMVSYLLDQGARSSANLDGRWQLHVAFQTGQAALIPLLRERLQDEGLLQDVEGKDAKEPTPLMVGIQMRKLSEEQLSQTAALTAESLALFTRHEPKCIPSFLERMSVHGGLRAAELAVMIEPEDLPRVIGECPKAAEAMLKALTERPVCESEGWHPLPSRISFAPRSLWQRMQDAFNPERELFSLCVPDQLWKYDTTTFKAPDWHQELIDTKLCKPIRDVDIKVCHVPDLVSADFLLAWCGASDDDNLNVYNNKVVRCVLETVWWKGAIKVDVFSFALSVVGLSLLLLDTTSGGPAGADGALPGFAQNGAMASIDFIAARALVDTAHEAAQFLGLARLGRARAYLDVGNVYDLTRCVLPAVLFFNPHQRLVRILVILIYWMRLLEVNFSESMARELLPIVRLAHGLGPATIVAFIGFCALTHAYCALAEVPFNNAFLQQSFSMLITADVTGGDIVTDPTLLQRIFTPLAVCAFSIFFLNIFIGVIGENYSIQKQVSHLVFLQVRAGLCNTYMLRSTVIPGWLFPKAAGPAAVVAGISMAVLQAWVMLTDADLKSPPVVFACCQATMLLCCYQNAHEPWARYDEQGRPPPPHYIWYAEARQDEPPTQLDDMQHCLRDLRDHLRCAKSPVNSRTRSFAPDPAGRS
uniref:Ion transport domain-containing protein n=1 Tax=Zooxanthella nutricula TaxID=1333877 RepID=A0A7S2QH57_9DINO